MKALIRRALLPGLTLSLLAGTAAAGERIFTFDAANFTPGQVIDNAFWPLMPGAVFVYYTESDGACVVNEIRVPGTTKDDFVAPYDDIVAWNVEDREWEDEECTGDYVLFEDTVDWFVPDNAGNIWYFGEDTTAYDHDDECPSDAGAWEAGLDGAEPGVVMPAAPVIGTWYQQEYFADEAEDRAKVLRIDAEVSTELGTYAGCQRTKEYSPIAPGTVEHKNYCPEGGGLVLIDELSGGKTVRVELIGSSRPPGDYATEGVCEAE
jgi:hypothetical protein